MALDPATARLKALRLAIGNEGKPVQHATSVVEQATILADFILGPAPKSSFSAGKRGADDPK